MGILTVGGKSKRLIIIVLALCTKINDDINKKL